MQMPRPGAPHEKMARLAGLWTGEEKIHPSPFDPEGGSARGRVENRLGASGFAIVQDYAQERSGNVNFEGHGVLTWDAAAGCYVMHWIDSMGTAPSMFRGSWQDDTLTLISDGAEGTCRCSWTVAKDGRSQTFRMETSPDGKAWLPLLEGRYTRS